MFDFQTFSVKAGFFQDPWTAGQETYARATSSINFPGDFGQAI